jgi:hypothetical protein
LESREYFPIVDFVDFTAINLIGRRILSINQNRSEGGQSTSPALAAALRRCSARRRTASAVAPGRFGDAAMIGYFEAQSPADDGGVARPVEKRRAYRPLVLKGATIIHGTRNSEMSCTVRNQHSGGAELSVPVETMIPAEFILYVPTDGIGYGAAPARA